MENHCRVPILSIHRSQIKISCEVVSPLHHQDLFQEGETEQMAPGMSCLSSHPNSFLYLQLRGSFIDSGGRKKTSFLPIPPFGAKVVTFALSSGSCVFYNWCSSIWLLKWMVGSYTWK